MVSPFALARIGLIAEVVVLTLALPSTVAVGLAGQSMPRLTQMSAKLVVRPSTRPSVMMSALLWAGLSVPSSTPPPAPLLAPLSARLSAECRTKPGRVAAGTSPLRLVPSRLDPAAPWHSTSNAPPA